MSLSKKIVELEKELDELNSRRDSKYLKKRSSKQACLNLLGIRYYEAIIILKRIAATLRRKKEIQDRKIFQKEKINDPETLQIINEYFRLDGELSVDLQSLYTWVYMIKEIFLKCKIRINLSELERISYLRNKFITHLTESSLFKKSKSIRSGMMFHANDETASILFMDILDNTKFIGFKKFIKQVIPYIPELANEKNMYEQIKILYKNIDKINVPRLKDDAYKFIKRAGIETESPTKIADELLKSFKEYKKIKRL